MSFPRGAEGLRRDLPAGPLERDLVRMSPSLAWRRLPLRRDLDLVCPSSSLGSLWLVLEFRCWELKAELEPRLLRASLPRLTLVRRVFLSEKLSRREELRAEEGDWSVDALLALLILRSVLSFSGLGSVLLRASLASREVLEEYLGGSEYWLFFPRFVFLRAGPGGAGGGEAGGGGTKPPLNPFDSLPLLMSCSLERLSHCRIILLRACTTSYGSSTPTPSTGRITRPEFGIPNPHPGLP
mmetsp:Transcript_22064/g.41394  ORF Transcript_22064/g.41394 Transcript_22064/m.41394 type:complete len:240 (+) Transcript_22064:483-1202(+)